MVVLGRRKTVSHSGVGNHVSSSGGVRSQGEGCDEGDSNGMGGTGHPASNSLSTTGQSFGHRQRSNLAAKLTNVSGRGRQRPGSDQSPSRTSLATATPERVLVILAILLSLIHI